MVTEELFEYGICYPKVRHPLLNEKRELKLKYVKLLEYYAEKHYNFKLNRVLKARIQQFKQDLLNGSKEDGSFEFDFKAMHYQVMRNRLSPFRLFSYRYIFIFDCLLLLAAKDKELGEAICSSIKENVHPRFYQKMDCLVEQIYSGVQIGPKYLITNEMLQ